MSRFDPSKTTLNPFAEFKALASTLNVVTIAFAMQRLEPIDYKVQQAIAAKYPKEFAEYSVTYTVAGLHRWMKSIINTDTNLMR